MTAEPDLVGRTLGDYQLLRSLGRGGMATVYLAEQASLKRFVAIKVLNPRLSEDPSYVQRFQHEAQAAANLVHANIVQIHEVGCDQGLHFIVQEYVVGGTLKQWLTSHPTVSPAVAVRFFCQIAAALHKAGELGVTHRDIKPENIMVTHEGEIKVMDFGLARLTRYEEPMNLTRAGETMGTPLYMSPEQVEGKTVDPRSDIYSLGITCYQLLSGKPPFRGETAVSIAVQHLRNDPPPLSEQRPDLPTELCRIVHKMLAKDPAQRYQHASELLVDLKALTLEDDNAEWNSVIREWRASEQAALTTSRVAVTQQLQQFMEDTPPQRKNWVWAAPILVVCFGLGALLAWKNRPKSVLQINPKANVTNMGTPRDQYFHASLVNTERAWKAVEKYYPAKTDPSNNPFVYASWNQLATLYRERGRTEDALQLYEQLVMLPEAENTFRAFGYAGQANIYFGMGQPKRWTQALSSLQSILPEIKQRDPRQHADLVQSLDPPLLDKLNTYDRTFPQPGAGPSE
ncbi:MAG: hypothetical protein CL681_22260 [Blastopirellula sp.]|nr:hypothetical protein [Blastopirellula sp.]